MLGLPATEQGEKLKIDKYINTSLCILFTYRYIRKSQLWPSFAPHVITYSVSLSTVNRRNSHMCAIHVVILKTRLIVASSSMKWIAKHKTINSMHKWFMIEPCLAHSKYLAPIQIAVTRPKANPVIPRSSCFNTIPKC